MKTALQFILFVVLGLAVGYFGMTAYRWLTTPPAYEQGDYSAYYQEQPSQIVLFGTEWCQYCKQTREWFAEQSVRYTDYDIEKDTAARNLYNNLKGEGVPVILIGGYRINGFHPEVMDTAVQALRSDGES